LIDCIDGWKLKLKRVVKIVKNQVIVRRSFGKVNVLDKGHLNCKSKNKCENADFEVGKFHDFNSSNDNTDADDIVNDPVFVGKIVSEGDSDSNKKTDDIEDSDFEEILNLDTFLKEVELKEEDDLIGADPNASDTGEEYESLKDGPCDIGGLSNNTKANGKNPKQSNHPIIDLDASTTH
jgi:hypothetical protein